MLRDSYPSDVVKKETCRGSTRVLRIGGDLAGAAGLSMCKWSVKAEIEFSL
jgi:hypothetical protein